MREIFSADNAQQAVDGVVNGYSNYLQERQNKKATMAVSGGYAFTRGNHIDDSLGKSKLFDDFTLSKAGYSWEYLQFPITVDDKKCLLITKNFTRLKNNMASSSKENYLLKLAKMNDSWIYNNAELQKQEPIQLELFSEKQAEEVTQSINNSEYEGFFILAYQIDSTTKHMTEIEVIMPTSRGDLISMQNLTPYLATSTVVIEEDAYAPILMEQDETEYGEYEYKVRAVEQAENN